MIEEFITKEEIEVLATEFTEFTFFDEDEALAHAAVFWQKEKIAEEFDVTEEEMRAAESRRKRKLAKMKQSYRFAVERKGGPYSDPEKEVTGKPPERMSEQEVEQELQACREWDKLGIKSVSWRGVTIDVQDRLSTLSRYHLDL
jgi:hypothetical protein